MIRFFRDRRTTPLHEVCDGVRAARFTTISVPSRRAAARRRRLPVAAERHAFTIVALGGMQPGVEAIPDDGLRRSSCGATPVELRAPPPQRTRAPQQARAWGSSRMRQRPRAAARRARSRIETCHRRSSREFPACDDVPASGPTGESVAAHGPFADYGPRLATGSSRNTGSSIGTIRPAPRGTSSEMCLSRGRGCGKAASPRNTSYADGVGGANGMRSESKASMQQLNVYVQNVPNGLSSFALLARVWRHCYICERLAGILPQRATTLAHLPGLISGARIQAGEGILHRSLRGDGEPPRCRRALETFAASPGPFESTGSPHGPMTLHRRELGARWT